MDNKQDVETISTLCDLERAAYAKIIELFRSDRFDEAEKVVAVLQKVGIV